MDIIKVMMIGIIGCTLGLFFCKNNKEYALFITIAAGILILMLGIKYIYGIIDVINTYSTKAGINSIHIGEFSSNLCLDSGNKTLAAKTGFFAKIMILYFSLPIIISLFSYIEEVLR